MVIQSRNEASDPENKRASHLDTERFRIKTMVSKYMNNEKDSDDLNKSIVSIERKTENEENEENLENSSENSSEKKEKDEKGTNTNFLHPTHGQEEIQERKSKTTLTLAEFKNILNDEVEEEDKPFSEKSITGKLIFLVEFPFKFITDITVPNVEEEKIPKIYSLLFPITSPLAIILLQKGN